MKTYHGTSERNLKSILKHGIMPRMLSKQSNHKGKIISRENFVYLSKGYPIYYGQFSAKNGEDIIVIEVEVNRDHLYPDEDFLGFAYIENFDGDLIEATRQSDPDKNQMWLDKCLEYTGNCCFKGTIPPSSIKRHMTIEPNIVMAAGGDTNPMAGASHGIKLWKDYNKKIEFLFDHGCAEFKIKLIEERSRLLKGEQVDFSFL